MPTSQIFKSPQTPSNYFGGTTVASCPPFVVSAESVLDPVDPGPPHAVVLLAVLFRWLLMQHDALSSSSDEELALSEASPVGCPEALGNGGAIIGIAEEFPTLKGRPRNAATYTQAYQTAPSHQKFRGAPSSPSLSQRPPRRRGTTRGPSASSTSPPARSSTARSSAAVCSLPLPTPAPTLFFLS